MNQDVIPTTLISSQAIQRIAIRFLEIDDLTTYGGAIISRIFERVREEIRTRHDGIQAADISVFWIELLSGSSDLTRSVAGRA